MDSTVEMKLPDDLQGAIITMAQSAINQAVISAKEKDSFRPYMTKTETAKYLHVSPKTLNDWEKSYKDIPVIVIEGVRRYNRTDLDKWMSKHKLNNQNITACQRGYQRNYYHETFNNY